MLMKKRFSSNPDEPGFKFPEGIFKFVRKPSAMGVGPQAGKPARPCPWSGMRYANLARSAPVACAARVLCRVQCP